MHEQAPQPVPDIAEVYDNLELFTAQAEVLRHGQNGPAFDVREVPLDPVKTEQARLIFSMFGIVPPDTMVVTWQSEFPYQYNTHIEPGSESVFLHLEYADTLTRVYAVTRKGDGSYITYKSDHFDDVATEPRSVLEQLSAEVEVTPIEFSAVAAVAEAIGTG